MRDKLLKIFLLFLPCVSLAESTKSPFKTTTIPTAQLSHVLLSLALVLLFIVLTIFIIKKLGNSNFAKSTAMKCLGGLALGPKERLVLIQAGDKQILLGLSHGNMQTIHVFDQPIVDDETLKGNGFATQFKQVLQGGGKR